MKNISFPVVFIVLFVLSIVNVGCNSNENKMKQIASHFIELTEKFNDGKIDVQSYLVKLESVDTSGLPTNVRESYMDIKNVAKRFAPVRAKTLMDRGISIGKSVVKGFLGDIGAVIDPLKEGYDEINAFLDWGTAVERFYQSLVQSGIKKEWLVDTLTKNHAYVPPYLK